MRKAIFAFSALALSVPVATLPAAPASAQNYKVYKGRDGRYYCRKTGGTTGAVVGGVAGALLGSAVGGTGATIVGAGAGALGGRAIERSRNKRRCINGRYR